MWYRPKLGRVVSPLARVIGLAALFAVGLQTDARAQSVVRRYGDANGRLISITDTGNLIEFFSSPTSEHIFSGNVEEGFVVAYDDRFAWSVHDSSSNVNPGPVTGPASGSYPNGTRLVATVVNTTQDGRVRIRSRFTWMTGTARVHIDTFFANNRTSGNVLFKTVKRFVDVNVDRILFNSFGTNGPLQAFAFNPGGRRFTLDVGPIENAGDLTPFLRVLAYHVDFRKIDFTVPDDRNAELGAESSDNDALVGFFDMRSVPGGGILASPGAEGDLDVFYTVQ